MGERGVVASWKEKRGESFVFPRGSVHSSHAILMSGTSWGHTAEYLYIDDTEYTWKWIRGQGPCDLSLYKGGHRESWKAVAGYTTVSRFLHSIGILLIDNTEIDMAIAVLTC